MGKDAGLLMAKSLVQLVSSYDDKNGIELAIAPSCIMISDVAEIIKGSEIKLAAQNCSHFEFGAYTGEVPAKALHEYGCAYVMVGHSERRSHFSETSDVISKKISMIKDCGMVPILCVGNDRSEENAESTSKMVIEQIEACLPKNSTTTNLVVAYEPTWAIGSGSDLPPTDYIKAVIEHVKKAVHRMISIKEDNLEIIYGGSVNERNYKSLLKENIGMLFGRASLDCVAISNILKYSYDFNKNLISTE